MQLRRKKGERLLLCKMEHIDFGENRRRVKSPISLIRHRRADPRLSVCACVRACALSSNRAKRTRIVAPSPNGNRVREATKSGSLKARPHTPWRPRALLLQSPPNTHPLSTPPLICRTPKRTGVKVRRKGHPLGRTEQWNRTHAVRGSHTKRLSGTRRHGKEGQHLNFGGKAADRSDLIYHGNWITIRSRASTRRSKPWHRLTVVS